MDAPTAGIPASRNWSWVFAVKTRALTMRNGWYMRHEVSIAGAPGDEALRCPPDQLAVLEEGVCQHQPPCPGVFSMDRAAARVVACHPEQGWSLLCNGVVLFDDAGVLLLGGETVVHDPVSAMPTAA
jgi:hypothetical protein